MQLPQLPQDKANHALYGALIACITMIPLGAKTAFSIVVCCAVLKELSDLWQNRKAEQAGAEGHHGVEFWDAVATMAGGALVLAPYLWHAVSHR